MLLLSELLFCLLCSSWIAMLVVCKNTLSDVCGRGKA